MSKKLAYTYSVLRYVHDIVTGEFINVGVVLHVPAERYLRVRTRRTIGRVRDVFPDFNRQAFTLAMHAVRQSLSPISREVGEGGLRFSESNAGTLASRAMATDDSSLQWSPLGSGLTDDPDKTLERLYARFVGRYDAKSRHRRTDDDIWRPVREQLEHRKVPIDLEEKVVSGETDSIAFKHAWKNGQWHAYEAISLDLADAEGIKEKARRWRGHLSAVSDGNREHLKLHFIIGRPQSEALKLAYEDALKILVRSPFQPQIYEENQVDELVAEIEDEVRRHAVGSPHFQ